MDDAANPATKTPEQKRQEKVMAAAAAIKNRALAGQKKAAPAKTAAKKATTRKTAEPKTASAGSAAGTGSAAPSRPARKTAAAGPPARRTAPPAEQERTTFYSARINLTTTEAQKKMLKLAAVEDGIDTTARIRAMIAAYEEDERLRKRIDKLAQHWR
ncbi:hypothetical protein ACFYNM_39365 [Streptomyces spororaveus]|uniref:hypothetical protein n=1 Tax=Streptomyces spororaveus TaxID=284039 RepID=UPI0036C0642E